MSFAAQPLPSSTPGLRPLNVMIVDDSVVMRGMISRMILDEPGVAVVAASVGNGQEAVDRAKRGNLDVVILDIEMPVMDGLTALPLLLQTNPNLVVIMASTLTTRNADISLKALNSGAKDYIPKPSSLTPGAGAAEFKRELIEKLRALGSRYRTTRSPAVAAAVQPAPLPAVFAMRAATALRSHAIAIGSSTGGPNALVQLLKNLKAPLRVPVFVTQHMPPTFTTLLAQNLTRDTGHQCVEAVDGMPVMPGKVYIAPGDYHLTVERKGVSNVIRLNQDAKENFCRPAVDPMLRSLSKVYGQQLTVCILTGMGQDGLIGAQAAADAGANVLAQDEASSVVWGMPAVVAKAGIACLVAPPTQLAARLNDMVGV